VRLRRQPASEAGEVPSVGIEVGAEEIELAMPSAESLETKRSNRDLAGSILAIHEVAMREKTSEKRRTVFTRLLMRLLSRW